MFSVGAKDSNMSGLIQGLTIHPSPSSSVTIFRSSFSKYHVPKNAVFLFGVSFDRSLEAPVAIQALIQANKDLWNKPTKEKKN